MDKYIENIKEETDEDYMQKVDEIIEFLNDKLEKDYINILINREDVKILIAYIHFQEDLVKEMLEYIKKRDDNVLKKDEEIMEYFFCKINEKLELESEEN